MDKFGRRYELTIDLTDGGSLTVKLPFTMEFDITRNSLSSANIASVRVYNLSEKHRNLIRKDFADTFDLNRKITLKAGYGDNIPIIFTGDISTAWSVRESDNFITQIECFDAGFAYTNAIINQSFQSGTEQQTIIETLAASLGSSGVSMGAIGTYAGKLTRGASYSGNTMEQLDQISGGASFIDSGKIHVLGDSECIEGPIKLIDSASGLLGTPLRENQYLNFDVLFEPWLIIGQKIELKSVTEQNFNGFHKIVSVKHKGTISESICGDAVTSVGVFAPTKLKTVVQRAGFFQTVGRVSQ